MAYALAAHALSKRYGDTWALTGIDLRVPHGGITALIGPNGAGKSTLMKLWLAFERPTSGVAYVNGTDSWADPERAVQSLSYIPQQPALHRSLSVSDHLRLCASLRPSFDVAGARERLDALGIPLKSKATRLSGGQQAQVGLALALGARAPILLLDEPLASLDPLARREFLDVLRQGVTEQGLTAVLSSHIVTDIEQVCDRLLVLGRGRVVLDAPIGATVDQHRVAPPDTPADPALDVAVLSDGTRLRRAIGEGHVGRAATLDEIVLGYLTAARAADALMATDR